MVRVRIGASYLSKADRRIFDLYDSAVVSDDPTGQRSAIRLTRCCAEYQYPEQRPRKI